MGTVEELQAQAQVMTAAVELVARSTAARHGDSIFVRFRSRALTKLLQTLVGNGVPSGNRNTRSPQVYTTLAPTAISIC